MALLFVFTSVPCGYGMYQSGEFCERCPRGYYQDEIKQTTCKPCPEGWTTAGLQSENVTECDGKLFATTAFLFLQRM